ncbi:hypothetical protein QUB76_23175, partial [Microcoleus sp. D2B6]|uniref:hypothetical protein n=1 Tax=Microcoleus sp. D2B6 TaxID=3055331 RepID=UPI002FCE7DD2
RIIDNAAISLVEQAGKPVHQRIIDNAVNTQPFSFSTPPSTVNSHSGTIGIDVMFAQSAKIVISSKDAIATSAFSK